MKIKSIKVGRRDKEKLVIYTECGRCISARVDDAYMLREGDELLSSRADELEEKYNKTRVLKSAAGTLARRSVSKYELNRKLRDKGFSDEESRDAVEWFSKRGFLDDEAYAGSIVQYYSSRGYGSIRIKEELSRRGIDRAVSDELIEALPERTDEISSLIFKKLGKEELTAENKRKIVAFLMRRGFRYDEIRVAFENISQTPELDSEDFQ